MATVLFICDENIGRSQIAEAFFNFYSKKHRARSCVGYGFREAEITPENVEIMMKEYGIDMNSQKPKPFSRKMAETSDRIVVMCEKSQCPIIENAEYWNYQKWEV